METDVGKLCDLFAEPLIERQLTTSTSRRSPCGGFARVLDALLPR